MTAPTGKLKFAYETIGKMQEKLDRMKFIISYDDMQDLFVMNGYAERFVSGHLARLAKVFGVTDALTAESESHQHAILADAGIDIVIEGGF